MLGDEAKSISGTRGRATDSEEVYDDVDGVKDVPTLPRREVLSAPLRNPTTLLPFMTPKVLEPTPPLLLLLLLPIIGSVPDADDKLVKDGGRRCVNSDG